MKLDIGSAEARFKDYTTVDLYAPEADVKADAGALPFDDNSVEAIWASHILEHIPPPRVQPVLREWLRVLEPGGTATIATPDLDDACRAWLERRPAAQGMIFGMYEGEGQMHYMGWGPLELREELRLAGFEILSVQTYRETAEDNLGGTYWHDMVNLFAVVRKPA
jgi:ubiquinone/menaquinone biosynthesis C-methylase UbiE